MMRVFQVALDAIEALELQEEHIAQELGTGIPGGDLNTCHGMSQALRKRLMDIGMRAI